ncbi:hypothetical protein K7432_001095 [Basidiobolus ranarum]|uniref:Homeobox domain-containing protein n=1 Tax=Basidiobolus ranarum TaxID=34480 RepID=A0ABR2WA49_9FUNG
MSQTNNSPPPSVLPVESELPVESSSLSNDNVDQEELNAENLNWVNTNYDEFASFDPASISRKTRRRTNKQEQSILETAFQTNQRPDIATREKLAKELGMGTRAIQIWFQNKRQTLKKKKAEPLIVPVHSDQEEDSDEKGPGFTVLKISDCRVVKRPQISWPENAKTSPPLKADVEIPVYHRKKSCGYPSREVDLQEHKRRKSFSRNIPQLNTSQQLLVSESTAYESEGVRGSIERRRLSDLSDYSNPLPLTPETPSTTFIDKPIPSLSKGAFLLSPSFSATCATNALTTIEPLNSTNSQSTKGVSSGWSPVRSQAYTPLSPFSHSPQSFQLPPITPIQGPGISPLAYQHNSHTNPSSMDPLILPPPLIPEESTHHGVSDGHSRHQPLPSLRTLPENHDLSLSPLVLRDPASPMIHFPGSSSKMMTNQGQTSPFFLSDPMAPLSLKFSSIDEAQKEKIRPRV